MLRVPIFTEVEKNHPALSDDYQGEATFLPTTTEGEATTISAKIKHLRVFRSPIK